MRVVIHGFGKMGQEVLKICESKNIEVVAIFDRVFSQSLDYLVIQNYEKLQDVAYDVLVDFSHAAQIDDLLNYLDTDPHRALIATTNLETEQLRKIKKLTDKMPIYQDYNTSYGVFVLNETVKFMNSLLPTYDVELVETHHRFKVDAPSGTAKKLLDTLTKERQLTVETDYSTTTGKEKDVIGVHAIRSGGVSGEHQIIFGSEHDLLEVKHTALNKGLFADSSVLIAERLMAKSNGLYKLEDIFLEEV